MMPYLDVTLELVKDSDANQFSYRVKSEALTEVETELLVSHFPLNPRDEVERFPHFLRQVALKPAKATDVEDFFINLGTRLFDSLFAGERRFLWQQISDFAKEKKLTICLCIYSQDTLLVATPWELLYDSIEKEFLCLKKDFSLTRLPHLPRKLPLELIELPQEYVSMIIAGASPIDAANPHEKDDIETIEQNIPKWLLNSNRLKAHADLRLEEFETLIQKYRPYILHLIVHGASDKLLFENEQKRTKEVSYKIFGQKLLKVPPARLIVLSVCFSDAFTSLENFTTLAHELKENHPAVVAMRSAISSPAAIEFSESFYKALSKGKDVSTAVGAARRHLNQLKGPESMQWSVPVLYQSAHVIPFKIIHNAKQLKKKPQIPIEKLSRIHDELVKAQCRLNQVQSTVEFSTLLDRALIRDERYHFPSPEESLNELLLLEGSFDPQWADKLNEIWYSSEQVFKQFEIYQEYLENLVNTSNQRQYIKLRRDTHEAGEQLQSSLSSILTSLSQVLHK